MLADPDWGRKTYLKHHIPGAYFMDTNLDLSSPVIKGVTGRHPLPEPEVFMFTLRTTGLHHGTQVIAYDQSNGMYASRAWWLLRWLGHQQVAVLDGGLAAWLAKGFSTDNQWTPPAQGSFSATINADMTVSRAMVKQGVDTLVDSRAYNRFLGETEPIDPIAGHIQGAVCIPHMDNTDDNGFWQPADFLRDKFSGLSHEPAPVFYCGSGISACHNILAYHKATGRMARLYPGSWSEWINYYEPVTGP